MRWPRRFTQFSLRALFLLITVAAIGFAWFGGRLAQARRQQSAVQELRAAKCVVEYDYEEQKRTEPDAPAWLRNWLGDDYYSSVVHVDMSSEFYMRCGMDRSPGPPPRATSATLSRLADLPTIESLSLQRTFLTGADFKLLLPLQHLQRLDLIDAQIPDEGFEYISRLEQLQELCFGNTKITGRATSHLSRLTNLKEIRLFSIQIENDGLGFLRSLPQLEVLRLRLRSAISDNDLENVRNLKILKELDIDESKATGTGLLNGSGLTELKRLNASSGGFSDDGVLAVERMAKLEYLNLDETKITDVSMQSLASLKSLKVLRIAKTKVTDDGLAWIKNLTQLEELALHDTMITDQGMSHLANLENLKRLYLPDGISNEGFQHLAGLTALEDLQISECLVDDEGLKYLKKMKNLQHMYISQRHLSDVAVLQLRAEHPGLKVDFPPAREKIPTEIYGSQLPAFIVPSIGARLPPSLPSTFQVNSHGTINP